MFGLFKKKAFIIFGAQGSGKGTQAKTVCEKYNIIPISTGDLFRANIKNETELGKLAQSYMNKGELVPDAVTIKMLKERLSKPDAKNGVLLDGFPRNKSQLVELLKFAKILLVVNMDVKREILLNRLAQRKVCKACGINKDNENNGDKCKCGGEFVTRKDDADVAAVNTRLNTYDNETKPLLEEFRTRGITVVDVVIEEEGPIEATTALVKEKLNAVKI